MSCGCGCDKLGELGADPPKPPPGWDDCKDAPHPEECRKIIEAMHCLRNPRDPWCLEQEEKRRKERANTAAVITFVLGVYVGGWVMNKWHTR